MRKYHVLVVCEISNAVIEQVTKQPLPYSEATKILHMLNRLDHTPNRANMLQEVFK